MFRVLQPYPMKCKATVFHNACAYAVSVLGSKCTHYSTLPQAHTSATDMYVVSYTTAVNYCCCYRFRRWLRDAESPADRDTVSYRNVESLERV